VDVTLLMMMPFVEVVLAYTLSNAGVRHSIPMNRRQN